MATRDDTANEVLDVRVVLDPPRARTTIAALSVAAFFLKARWTNLVKDQAFVVVVFKKMTGEQVVEFRHRTRWTAWRQARSIRGRLNTLSVADMSAHLGVPSASVL